MTHTAARRISLAAIACIALMAAGCDSDDDGGAAGTPTATRTATRTSAPPTTTATSGVTVSATPSPTATQVAGAAVAGLIVVDRGVGTGERDNLNQLPPGERPGVGTNFDRGLGNADWTIDDGVLTGSTDAEGRFSISGLSPGRHLMRVRKTVGGNLLEFAAPIVVGDDGAAEVIAEVSWGLVRSTSEYVQDGAAMRAVFAPNGSSATTRAGALVEFSDGFRTLVDGDGDGRFDGTGSCDEFYACDANGGCGSPERICMCVPSCPDCQDCVRNACIPRAYFHTPECGPDGLCKPLPYACGDSQTCGNPGDQCTCVSSCLGCDDCPASVCAQPCSPGQPISIARVDLYAQPRLVVGQEAGITAVALLSDGTSVDVTWLATWASSAPANATVDSWGRVAAVAAGSTAITAGLGTTVSAPQTVTVVERPTLQAIILQNASCWYYPVDDPTLPPGAPRPDGSDAFFPPPNCRQVVRVGATIQFIALGQFDTGYTEDITDEVEWSFEPAGVGSITGTGLFTAAAAGETQLTARLAGISSDAQTIKVVTEPTIVSLSIYPGNYAYPYIDGGPARPEFDQPCFECGYYLTLLRGDTLMFSATAHYDTGEWEDVTSRVTWRSGDRAVASIDAAGLLSAVGAGETTIDASLGAVTSAAVTARVVNEATLQSLYIYQDGQDRAVGVGDQAVFHAIAYYDIGISRDVTDEATWRSSDTAVGSFDTGGVLTGRGAGNITVWAELGGQIAASLPLEIYARSELDYCDPTAVNRGTWSDDFNRVTLESDCGSYTIGDVAELRFTVTEMQRPGGIFDPCLDLYAYRGDTLVRTIRQEGCGDPFLAPAAPDRDEAALKYQLKAFWDLKDEAGAAVPPGLYTIRGIFYLYYDPIVEIDVAVNGPN